MNTSEKRELGAKASSSDAAMEALARLLATRERSVEEARERLRKKGYLTQAVEEAIQRARTCDLLNDQRFAQNYITGRLSAGWGTLHIEQGLRKFGIATEAIEGYPAAFFSEDSLLEKACTLLNSHRSNSKNPRQAAYRYLASRGYSPSVVATALKKEETLQQREEEYEANDAAAITSV